MQQPMGMLALLFLLGYTATWLSQKGLKKHRSVRTLSLPFWLIGHNKKNYSQRKGGWGLAEKQRDAPRLGSQEQKEDNKLSSIRAL